MANRRPKHRRVKVHRSYTVEETAILVGAHKNTVREWIKIGLPVIDDKRPMLILGHDLADFFKARRTKNKRACQPGQMYCVRCRAPQMPAGNMADYVPDTDKLGNLKAICPSCDSIMNRRVSRAKLAQVCGELEIAFPQGLDQVSNSVQPTVNSDLE
jgi:hypothetical protein